MSINGHIDNRVVKARGKEGGGGGSGQRGYQWDGKILFFVQWAPDECADDVLLSYTIEPNKFNKNE